MIYIQLFNKQSSVDGGLMVATRCAQGVEAVSFPLEDRCADLMQAGIVQKAALDALPFPDAEFQLVTAFNTLEYIPRDKLDSVLAELVRVAQMRVFVTVQLPDMDADEMLGPEDIKPESFFPRLWWIERLEAHGLSVVPTRMVRAPPGSVYTACRPLD